MAAQANVNQIPFPQKLDMSANLATEWRRFHAQWTNYCVATDLNDAPARKRTATFLAIIGNDAYSLFESLDFGDQDRDDIDVVVAKFREHCVGETNVTYERYVFNKRSQDTGESFDTFLADLRRLIKTCEYGALEESILKDRIVMGIHNDTTRRKLLQTRQLTLAVAVDICRASELASRQLKAMAGADAVERVDTKPKFKRDFRGRSPSRTRADAPRRQHSATRQTGNNTDRNRKCKFCLRSHEFVKSACFAWQKTCNDCGKKNHFSGSSVCHKQSRTSDVRSVDEELLAVVGKNKNRKYTTLLVNGHRSKLLLDSGSTINVYLNMAMLGPTEFIVRSRRRRRRRSSRS